MQRNGQHSKMRWKRLFSQNFSHLFELSETALDEQVDTDQEERQLGINSEHEHDEIVDFII